MRPPQIRPFSGEHLDEAARLLAERHRRHRAAEPLLPADLDFRALIDRLLQHPEARGWAGLRDGRVVAYLIGTVRGGVAERHTWIDYAGHAAEDAEDIRDVYAAAAAHWVEDGRMQHYVQTPAHDKALIDAWFRLSFGLQHADALREVPSRTEVRLPDRVEIRRPEAADIEALLEVDLALPRHHRSSPVFSTRPLPDREALRAEWKKTLSGNDETVFAGYLGGRPVAVWALVDGERHMADLIRPRRTCHLSFAATVPYARGSGIGVALTDAALAWAAEEGYAVMGTDWRMANLLASRFWPRRGFRPTFYRLYRHVP